MASRLKAYSTAALKIVKLAHIHFKILLWFLDNIFSTATFPGFIE